MEVASFFVDFHHFLSIFTIFYRFSRFAHFCRDLRNFSANFFWPKQPSPQHHTFFACMLLSYFVSLFEHLPHLLIYAILALIITNTSQGDTSGKYVRWLGWSCCKGRSVLIMIHIMSVKFNLSCHKRRLASSLLHFECLDPSTQNGNAFCWKKWHFFI